MALLKKRTGIGTNSYSSIRGSTGLEIFNGGVNIQAGDFKDNGTTTRFENLTFTTLSSDYTLVWNDNSKCINIGNNTLTIPSGVFESGHVITIYNSSSSSTPATISPAGGVTLRYGGTTMTGTRYLGKRGVGLILCVNSNGNEFVTCGAGMT